MEPDLDGFREAQRRLTGLMGQDVTFYEPVAATWPAGTSLDPETGRPFDPTIRPSASGQASASVKASVVFRPLIRVEGQTVSSALGMMGDNDVAVLVDQTDHDKVKNAERFVVSGVDYKMTEINVDPFASGHRYICFGETR